MCRIPLFEFYPILLCCISSSIYARTKGEKPHVGLILLGCPELSTYRLIIRIISINKMEENI